MNEYHIPKNEQPMDELYAALSIDEKGNEGIVSIYVDDMHMPVVFGHKRMIELTKPLLKQAAKDTGKTIRIVKFQKCEILDIIKND